MVEADQAEIQYANSPQGKEIVERFTLVNARLLEQAERPFKNARAKEAIYHYATQELEASTVVIEDFSPALFSYISSDHLSYNQEIVILTGYVVFRGQHGEVYADFAEMPLLKREGVLRGNVEMRFPGGMCLTCGYAQFDENSRNVRFSDIVKVTNPDGTQMTADQMTLVVGEAPTDGGIAQGIMSLKATGNVFLSRDQLWSLTADAACYDKSGDTIEFFMEEGSDKSLFFTDSRGKIYARHAVFDTNTQECTLTGNVKMIHREGALEQYALADRVIMIKGEKEIRFFSDQGRKVLFYDKINRLQMSAPEISVVKDPLKNKNVVKGKGKVRFHFKDEEYERLREYFLIEKING